MTHETSYSAQFKGETSKPSPADNKYLERRRIRTLYSEPYKEPPKVRNSTRDPSLLLVGHVQHSKAGLTLLAVTPLVWCPHSNHQVHLGIHLGAGAE